MKALYYSRRYQTQPAGVEPTRRSQNCVAEGDERHVSRLRSRGPGRTACNWDCVIALLTICSNQSGLLEVERVIRP